MPAAIGELHHLKKLTLSHSQLESLPATFAALQALEILDLSYGKFTCLPQEISKLPGLKALNFSHNYLCQFPQSLLALSELKSLDLGYTQLTALPPGIARLQNLQALVLAGNQIGEFLPESGALEQNLCYLDVSGNPLRSLPESFLKKSLRRTCWADDEPQLKIIGFSPET